MSTVLLSTSTPQTLIKSTLIGGSIGLFVISMFLFQTGGGKPEFESNWMSRPLIIVPVATMMGGAAFQFIRYLVQRPRWARIVLTIFGSLVFIISLWLGMVLGLAGTYWH